MADELYKTSFYNSWDNMKRRSSSKKNRDYYRYGAVGRGMIDRWADFQEFKKDMYPAYLEKRKEVGEKERLSLDRINNDKGYSPDNCRWATQAEQTRNTNRNRWFVVDGERGLLTDLAKKYNICYVTVEHRIRRGWGVERSFKTPPTSVNQFTAKRNLPTGVYQENSKYCARHRNKYLGAYETIKDARRAYQQAVSNG